MLKLYENIRYYRKLNKWTQEELASRMGYTDRSMIAKIESGKVDLSQSKIMEFAKVFNVDPGELMGWEEPEVNTADQFIQFHGKTDADRTLLEMYHNVPPEVRTMVDYLLKSAQPSSEVPDPKNDKAE